MKWKWIKMLTGNSIPLTRRSRMNRRARHEMVQGRLGGVGLLEPLLPRRLLPRPVRAATWRMELRRRGWEVRLFSRNWAHADQWSCHLLNLQLSRLPNVRCCSGQAVYRMECEANHWVDCIPKCNLDVGFFRKWIHVKSALPYYNQKLYSQTLQACFTLHSIISWLKWSGLKQKQWSLCRRKELVITGNSDL